MVTAFVDMVGLLMVLPLLPFYAQRFVGHGPFWSALNAVGMGGEGTVIAILVSSFAIAQLASAPLWGRVSDRYGRRPALLIGLASSGVAYIVFAFAGSLELLLLSRIVQGAGGGTVGVIQAYVADATEPKDRAKALGWLSAATNAGVALGPAIGSFAARIGTEWPGLVAAMITLVNVGFAWKYLTESNEHAGVKTADRPKISGSRETLLRVTTHPGLPASRLIWIYAIGMGAFHGMNAILALFLNAQFGIDATNIGWVFVYIGVLSVFTRAVLLGPLVDRFREPRLARYGGTLLALGMAALPFTTNYPTLALAILLVPLGTAFTFPCVTGMLSQVIPNHERGLYMGVQQTFGGITRVIGPLWAGFAFDYLGKGVPFWTGAGLAAFTVFLGIGIEKHIPGHQRVAA
ncbi:MAG: MFS transporter [Gemmatimonadaceae bacterium]|nr:MFS transporter [Gemmatimonadaceae bacterium]MCW5827144.1 MFS transporter [Gemmatimonadaceae bacterium]